MSTLTYKKFEDVESSGQLPDKMTVFQSCQQTFNASPIQAKRCRLLLSRLLRLLYAGETFPRVEATKLFFSVSKLFHHEDASLRQLVYLAIKELSPISDDILMATASIMKDIQNGEIVYKPNAVRTLARVLDGSTIPSAERLMKNCVVDRNQSVSSAALVSSYHLLPVAKDVVKRWTNETHEAISATKTIPQSQYSTHEFYGNYGHLPSSTYAYQYHALGLLYQLRNHDKMALMKMIQQLNDQKPLMNSFAVLQLIRFVGKLIEEDGDLMNSLWPLFQNWLGNKSDMVELEAAKAILALPRAAAPHQMAAISTLKSLLSVPRTVTRFAAVRLLNKIAMKDPEKIRVCNDELESMINDSNRSIATYAITTLLKTGSTENVDRLVKTISNFMDDISDEFKIIVIEAIGTLSLKFPEKYKSMLEFLNGLLGEEGGAPIKTAIVDAILDIVKFIPDSRDFALNMLCEFIEDCEYTNLATKVIFILGEQGPNTSNPSLYVRHIYNRVVLENSIVRCAAVSALSKFALIDDESLTSSIKILLKRCLQDADDEVRDRAALALRFLSSKDKEQAKSYVDPQFGYWLADLEKQLTMYVNNEEKASFNTPFDISVVTAVTSEQLMSEEYKLKKSAFDEPVGKSNSDDKSKSEPEEKVSEATKQALLQQKYADELSTIPEIAAYGSLLHSSAPSELTDKDSEFIVTAIKHIFQGHLIVQYNIQNTLLGAQLEDVSIVVEPENEEYAEEFIVPIEVLKPTTTGSIYVSFTRPDDIEVGTFENNLTFTIRDVDKDTGEPVDDEEGYPDEYPAEPLTIVPGDFIIPQFTANFTKAWDELDNENSTVYNLGDSSSVDLQDAVNGLVKTLSMMPLESTNLVASSANHTLKLFGKTIQGDKVAGLIKLASSSRGVMMKCQCRSTNAALSEMIVNNIE